VSRPELSWVVAEGEARALGAWLEDHAPKSGASALADGRVFVDGRRLGDADFQLSAGARVELFAARRSEGELGLLARFDGLVAVDKPAGMATEPDHAGIAASVVARAAELLGVERATVHAMSRLDVGVSGVVLLALDRTARKRVEALREAGRLRRRYVAVARATPSPPSGVWDAPIGRGCGSQRSAFGRDAERAETRYRVAAQAGSSSLLALEPVTGRTHQLRVHAAHAGCPLYGDATYGGPKHLTKPDGAVIALRRIALHAAWIELPFSGGVRVESALPAALHELWSALAGAEEGLASALE
jgi:23S rRNA-/tRNA-specific pseudouridylate synthase